MSTRPVIGITGAYVFHNKFMDGTYVHHDYQKAIHANGGLPVILPYVSEELAEDMVDHCDAILLSGGEDVDPQFYGQDPHRKLGSTIPLRDTVELAVLKVAMEKQKPILAICRGVQILNVALGGTLFQDIPSQVRDSIQHTQTVDRSRDTHWATIDKNSRLYEILGVEKERVNSLHHQAIDGLAEELNAVAKSSDGIIEAVEHKSYPAFLLGIQWHPESMAATYERMNEIFAQFVAAAK
ncbi:gamma-glutamyl-gamma-aminobutyrate hydrolase family protein [Niallia taxi]|uniref:gamma-glutamyl-gamma-aminobutyrate hydrolase family protein n=1 Tax=Niallia taxi TaxID=2499688 RepID=UPI002E21D8DF|nr:gamma-glutamyl-gamma-aminobutyrate hydrolase family protein [Niallia taxi]